MPRVLLNGIVSAIVPSKSNIIAFFIKNYFGRAFEIFDTARIKSV